VRNVLGNPLVLQRNNMFLSLWFTKLTELKTKNVD